MSTLAQHPEVATITPLPSRRKYLDYAVFTLCASLYLFPFMRLLLYGTDEGTQISGAIRILHGQVFARDFFEVMGPGTFYWLAAFFKLFGVSFLAARLCLFISSLGTALSMYFLSRRVCGPYRTLPCFLLAGTYFGMLWPIISHHVDSNFVALLSVVFVVLWLDRRKRLLLIAAGALAGAALCIHQPKGGLLFVAIVLWLCWVERRRPAELLRSIALLSAGFVAIVGVVLAYFWSHGALWDLFYTNFLWPSAHYGGSVNNVRYAQGFGVEYWRIWAGPAGSALWRIPMAALLSLPFLLVAALPLVLAIFGIRNWKSFSRPEILLYWICGWAMWASEMHRKDICHLVFGAPLLLILCVYYLEQYRAKAYELLLQVLAISAVCLACYGLLLSLVAHPVVTRFGTVHLLRDDPILASLEAHAAPGEEIFAYPYIPMYYVLSGTLNPTRYTLLTYTYNTQTQFQDAVHTLETHRVKWIVWDTSPDSQAGGFLFPLPKGAPRVKPIMEPYLQSHYRVVRQEKETLLMERTTEAP